MLAARIVFKDHDIVYFVIATKSRERLYFRPYESSSLNKARDEVYGVLR